VRLALGATPRGLVGHALWQAARWSLAGGAIGIAGAILFAIWLGDTLYLVPGQHSGLLYGVTATDPVALAAALGGVLAIALVAAIGPARRIARVDPVEALRTE
jgi:putative ABC transport system permease protein